MWVTVATLVVAASRFLLQSLCNVGGKKLGKRIMIGIILSNLLKQTIGKAETTWVLKCLVLEQMLPGLSVNLPAHFIPVSQQ